MKNFVYFLLFFFVFGYSLVKSQDKNEAIYEKSQKYLYEDPDKAILIGNELVSTETNINKKIKYYLYLSKAFTAKRNTDQSFKTLLKAQELVKTTKDVPSKIDVLILIAIQYQQMELYQKSFETLDEVDQLCRVLGPEFNRQKNSWLGKSFAVKGIIYKSQGNNEIALEKFFRAVKYIENAEPTVPNINNLSIVYYNIGYCYFNLKNTGNAQKYFNKSIEFARESNAQSLEAYALKGLAENYMLQNNSSKSIELLEQAKTKAIKIGDLTLDEGIYKLLAENYLGIGDFRFYLENNDQYKKVQFQREQSELKSINSLLNTMETHNKNEINIIDRNNGIIRVFMIVFSGVIFLFLLFKAIKINKLNQINKKKIQELITK